MKRRVSMSLCILMLGVAAALGIVVVISRAEGQEASFTPPSPPGFSVKVGIIVPLSGAVQSYGESTRDGALIAIQQARDAGWTIETVFADSQCDAQQAVSVTNHLIYDEGVEYIIGAVCSSASIPISEIAEANHVVQISPSSTSPQVTVHADGTNKEYIFRACFLDPFQGRVMASVAKDLDAITPTVLYDAGNDYVSGLAGYFKSSFEDMGGSVPVFEAYTSSDTDFTDLLTQVDDANADVLFLPDYYGKVNQIAAQADGMGIQARLLGADGWDSPGLQLGPLDGAYFSTHFWPEDPRQVVVDFVQAYSVTHGTRPDTLAALGYDAAGLLIQAIAEAGADDPAVVKDELAAITYEGVTDKIAFNQFGDPIKGAAIINIEGGQRTFVKFVAPVSKLAVTSKGPTDLGDPTTLAATVATGSDVVYTWALGDGATGNGRVVTHTYATAGAYMVAVTATNTLDSITAQTAAVVRETVTLGSGSAVTTSNGVLYIAATPALTRTLSITYTPQITPGYATDGFAPVGVTFYLDAAYLPEGTPVTGLSTPLTLTIHYNEAALIPHLREGELQVHRYDADIEDWVPLPIVARDWANNTITVLLDHFSEYALLGPIDRERVYLPLVMR